MNENPSECEIAYDTALWMLYAILDDTMQEGEPVGEEDKVHVQNCTSSVLPTARIRLNECAQSSPRSKAGSRLCAGR